AACLPLLTAMLWLCCCPRGAMGRQGAPLTEELLSMPVITDVDGGRWRPVNEEALQEAITLLKEKGDE
uniref:hypothetical protein n=1 Tax=Candidatus Scatomorpha intestinigallinarum TaxID=2840923 RepID=UPI0040253516